MGYEVRPGDYIPAKWDRFGKGYQSYNVYNGKCHIAGPYRTKELAEQMKKELEELENGAVAG
jgi:hypothetical protein